MEKGIEDARREVHDDERDGEQPERREDHARRLFFGVFQEQKAREETGDDPDCDHQSVAGERQRTQMNDGKHYCAGFPTMRTETSCPSNASLEFT